MKFAWYLSPFLANLSSFSLDLAPLVPLQILFSLSLVLSSKCARESLEM